MGNSQSSASSKPASATLRKPSSLARLLRTRGACKAGSSISLSDASDNTIFNDKDVQDRPQTQGSNNPAIADETMIVYQAFLKVYPQYALTQSLDTLRRSDFTRLEKTGEIYVDFMGGSLYPESLVRAHTEFLIEGVFGNTHSVSNSSNISSRCTREARAAVLSFFKAPQGYTVIFTSNASGALKLIGESFPFNETSSFVLGVDSHNSVHGIREFASRAGAKVQYIATTEHGGFLEATAKAALIDNQPRKKANSPSLFALTGLSNVTNSKCSPSMIEFAASLGYCTLLDAAALASSSSISLSEWPHLDAMAVSFYKMFGYPTGVGALIVKETFLSQLKRPWFSGGNVDLVQVPGSLVTKSPHKNEQFEDGTINYLSLPAITSGLRFLSPYLPVLPLRLSCILHFLISALSTLRHDTTNTPVVRILSSYPQTPLQSIGEQSNTGFIISLIFLMPSGDMMPNSFVEHAATAHSISLRTGCMCNYGGVAGMLGAQDLMQLVCPGVSKKEFERIAGRELGVVRISLGLATSFHDAWKLLQFGQTMRNRCSRQALWDQWTSLMGKD